MLYKDPSFPNSYAEPFTITSPQTRTYNCIAWAAEVDNLAYWPDPSGGGNWPDDIPLEATRDAFLAFYQTFDFELCDNGDFEKNYIKIAIFEKNGSVQHAARQLSNNEWTSKLGPNYDVIHTLSGMEGGVYGDVAFFMKKKVTAFRRRLFGV